VGREFRSVHPRDILSIVADHVNFFGMPPKLSNQLIDLACNSFFGMEDVKEAAEKNAA